jgi:hypothetical protein
MMTFIKASILLLSLLAFQANSEDVCYFAMCNDMAEEAEVPVL